MKGEGSELNLHFWRRLDRRQRGRILDMAAHLADRLVQWAAQYPGMRKERALPLAISVCAAAPFCDLDALAATAKVSLFVFALDDFFDEGGLPSQDLRRHGEQLCRVATGQVGPRTGGEPLQRALFACRDLLARYPLYSQLGDRWETAVCATMKGMVQEASWSEATRRDGVTALPPLDEYLATGRYSIGGPPHIWSALITIGDPSTPRHLDRLEAMEALASTCIRLANDLRSHEKELLEGKINALRILGNLLESEPGSMAHKMAAEAAVRREMSGRLQQLEKYRARPVTLSGQPEAAIADIAFFVTEFYSRHDFHTFSSTNS
jgi:hypothetical protein